MVLGLNYEIYKWRVLILFQKTKIIYVKMFSVKYNLLKQDFIIF